jgi:hypothetical protein
MKRLCKVITAQQNQPQQITYETPTNSPTSILQSCTLSYDWFVEEMLDTHKAGSEVAGPARMNQLCNALLMSRNEINMKNSVVNMTGF